jgi:hypothetical protein
MLSRSPNIDKCRYYLQLDNVQVRECLLDLGEKVVVDSQPDHSALGLTDEKASFF